MGRTYTEGMKKLVLAAAVLLASCDQNVAPPGSPARSEGAAPAAAHTTPPAAPAPAASASGESVAGVSWSAPARWIALAPRPMRAATYRVPAAAGDPEPGECAVFFFGAGQGGDVEANMKRWLGQFEKPGGGAEAGARTASSFNGIKVTTVDVSGTYLASAGPMSPAKESKPGYRLLGAIVEAPEGNVFFKFTGPSRTVGAAEAEFTSLLKSLRRR